jgi:hypothetical protein
MPSQRYYRNQAKILLSWSKATKDKAYAAELRLRAAKELERAEEAHEAVADLNPILAVFNGSQAFRKNGR